MHSALELPKDTPPSTTKDASSSFPVHFKIENHEFLLSPSTTTSTTYLPSATTTSPSKKAMPTPVPCNFEALSLHFHLPLKVAAEKFGVRATAFKKRCRAIGIRHWPYRKVRSLKRSLQELSRCKDQGMLNEKQQLQYANFKRQLDKLLSPETYGIDPNKRSSLQFDDDDENDSGDDDSSASSPSSPQSHPSSTPRLTSAGLSDKPLHFASQPYAMFNQQALFLGSDNGAHPYSVSGLHAADVPSISVRFANASAFDAYDHLLHDYKNDFSLAMDEFSHEDYSFHTTYADEHESYDDIFLHSSARSPTSASTNSSNNNSNDADVHDANSMHTFEDEVFQQISPDYGCLV